MLPEVAPEGVALVEALPTLGALCALVFCFGCVYVVDKFVRAIFGTISGAVGWIPYAGRVLAAPVHAIEHKITHALGLAEAGLDRYIAVSWHKLGIIARHIGRELVGLGQLIFGVAALLLYLAPKTLVHYLIRVATAPLRVGIHTLEREYKGIEHGIGRLEHRIEHGIIPRLREAEHAIEGVIEPDIARLRGEARALEDGAIRTFKWIRSHPWSAATGAFIGAVAFALARLGGGWIRCRNWNRIGRHVCGLPASLIESILGLSLAFLAVVDPLVIAKTAVETEALMDSIIKKIGDLNPDS